MTPLVFGSSKDILRPFWRVWFYDAVKKEVIPLAHYENKTASDTAAFDLAHSAASLSDPKEQDRILSSMDAAPSRLPEKLKSLFSQLAEKVIASSEAPSDRQSAVTVHKTPDDTVYAVRIPEGK